MKLNQLHYLIEAAKYKSISIAAEKNFIAQSTFSSAITNLEKELNIILLERNSKGVRSTQVGNIVIEKSNEIFSLINEIRALSPVHQAELVYISAIPCICDFLIPKCIVSLTKNNALLKLSIRTTESVEIVRNVASGFSSLGLIIDDETIDLGSLEYHPLFNDRYVLYVGQNSPLYNRTSITFEEAITEPYIAYREEFESPNSGLSSLFNKVEKPNIAFRTDELGTIRQMIEYSNYIAFFPEKMSRTDIYLQNGVIRAIPISDFDTRFTVGYVINPKYKLPYIISEFLDSLRINIASL